MTSIGLIAVLGVGSLVQAQRSLSLPVDVEVALVGGADWARGGACILDAVRGCA